MTAGKYLIQYIYFKAILKMIKYLIFMLMNKKKLVKSGMLYTFQTIKQL